MGVTWADSLNAIAAAGGTTTAVIALVAIFRANTISERSQATAEAAQRTAEASQRTAEVVVQIERDRWHHELTPQFKVTATRLSPGSDHVSLFATLEGPASLHEIDAVAITIRDDGYNHGGDLAGGPTREEVAQYIWGPLRFRPGVDGASPDGRSVPPEPLRVGDWRKLFLEPSMAPPWTNGPGYWRELYAGTPLRLLIECRKEGHKPWYLPFEVDIREPGDAAR